MSLKLNQLDWLCSFVQPHSASVGRYKRNGKLDLNRLEVCQPSVIQENRGKGVVNVFKGEIIMMSYRIELDKKVNEYRSRVRSNDKCLSQWIIVSNMVKNLLKLC